MTTTTTTDTTPTAAPERAATDWLPGLRAMIGKEIKQNGKWAALGLIALGVALAFAVGHNLPTSLDVPMTGNQFDGVWNGITLTLTFGPALIGLLLGLVQILPEQRRDLWAFLIHRPAPRAPLFWGKVCAGLALYAGATLLPLGACVAWVRTPGNVAGPFDPRLTLGALAGILMGLSFYFAALLTALRPARWYGSRALPIPAAIGAAFFVLALPGLIGPAQFWQAALLALAFAAVFCVAARGAFVSDGIYETQPRPARAGLGLVIYLGLLVTGVMITALGIAAHNVLFPLPVQEVGFQQYQITWAGQIVSDIDNNGGPYNIHTLDGTPVALPPRERELRANERGLTSGDMLSQNGFYQDPTNTAFNSPKRYVVSLDGGENEIDYYVPSQARFMIYDTITRLPLRSTNAPLPASQYAAETEGSYLVFDHALYRFDLGSLTAFPVLSNLGADTIRGTTGVSSYLLSAPLPNGMSNATMQASATVFETDRQLIVLADNDARLFAVPRVLPAASYDINAAVTPDGKKFFFWYRSTQPGLWDQIFAYNRQGALLRHVILPPLSAPSDNTPLSVSLLGLILPPPFSAVVIWNNRPLHAGESHWAELVHGPLWLKLFCLLSLLGNAVGAVLAWRIGLRCAFSRAGLWAWVFGAFWLGVSGALLLLCLREWPARETCPNCKKLRVVTRETCEHCGAPFAPVPRDGTEIVE